MAAARVQREQQVGGLALPRLPDSDAVPGRAKHRRPARGGMKIAAARSRFRGRRDEYFYHRLGVKMLAEDLIASRERLEQIIAPFHGGRLLGPKLAIVNPPLWEIGHVGWFQEKWCLREGTGKDSILKGAD